MTDTAHTPTPWKYTTNDIWSGSNVISMISGECNIQQDEANAAHIIKCVNSHDDLVEALNAALELADTAEGLTSCRSDDEFVWRVQAKIRAALAKAGEA